MIAEFAKQNSSVSVQVLRNCFALSSAVTLGALAPRLLFFVGGGRVAILRYQAAADKFIRLSMRVRGVINFRFRIAIP